MHVKIPSPVLNDILFNADYLFCIVCRVLSLTSRIFVLSSNIRFMLIVLVDHDVLVDMCTVCTEFRQVTGESTR